MAQRFVAEGVGGGSLIRSAVHSLHRAVFTVLRRISPSVLFGPGFVVAAESTPLASVR